MPDEFTDEVVTAGSKADNGDRGGFAARAPIEDEIHEGDTTFRDATRHEDSQLEGGIIDRVLPQAVEDRIAAIEAREKEARAAQAAVVDDVPDEETPSDETKPDEAQTSAPDPAAAAKPEDKKPEPAAVAPADDERYTRLETANKTLLAELEAERGKARELPAQHKLLTEATENYIEDQVGSARKFIAASLGIEDVNDPRVESEVRDFYADLTAHVIGVTPTEAHLAKRDAARARHLVAREKRERTAEKQSAADKARQDDDAKKADSAAEFIGNRLQTKRGDGRSIADDHPLVMEFAEELVGMKPAALIWRVLNEEAKTGRIAITADDDANIAAAIKLIETRYQALRDKFAKASPPSSTQPSTAPPNGKPSAATAEPRKDTRQSHGARNLTTADRSVAPAAPPAKKPEPKTERPKFKTKEEAQQWALRHLSD